MNKKKIAKSGKKLLEKAIFQARLRLVDKYLDPKRDSVLLPWATYSPWLLDEDFLKCHDILKDYTLVDLYRCYELWHLLAQTKDLAGDILEIGTWRGGTGGLLGLRSKMLGLKADTFLCDTFEGVVKSGDFDKYYSDGEHSDASVPVVSELMDTLDVDRVVVLKGLFPEETGGKIEDRTFRFCHIDVDVYQSGKDSLEWVWPRLPIGGIVVFDDFGFPSTPGITRLVHEKENNSDLTCVQNINGHAIFIKTG